MTETFVKHALDKGKKGAQWLKNIPNLIRKFEEAWSIKVDAPFTLSYNYVAPATRSDGTKAVLKIGFPTDKEFQTEIDALQVYNGEGIEKLLEVDKKDAVILIERETPGISLSEIEDDEQATKIIASVMKQLWKPLRPKHKFITIAEWAQGISRFRQQHNGTSGPLPSYLLDKAEKLFQELISSSAPPILVHGDLHHDNILSSDRAGWLAIDPKGIAAEPAYETAAMLRNPYAKLQNNRDLEKILSRRIAILSEELNIDPLRIQQWGIAQTVLSAVWSAEENDKGWEHTIAVAQVLSKIKI